MPPGCTSEIKTRLAGSIAAIGAKSRLADAIVLLGENAAYDINIAKATAAKIHHRNVDVASLGSESYERSCPAARDPIDRSTRP